LKPRQEFTIHQLSRDRALGIGHGDKHREATRGMDASPR
jgi:hypothetical protein